MIPLTAGSEEMSLVQLYIPSEVAHDTISELGEMGNVQFKDVSPLLTLLIEAQPVCQRLSTLVHA